VDRLARSLVGSGLPHPLLVDVARQAIRDGKVGEAAVLAEQARRRLLLPVVNATGVLLHTNLGRAPWTAADTGGYSNLELDLESGERGSRQARVGTLLARLCGAEDAIVVNNGAAAVLLALAAVAAGRGAAVSRGELVEIGGGFRVPEVMEQSGARLVEVGTTNRTRTADFERAIADPANDIATVLLVHQSNYRIVGFTERPDPAALVGLGVPVIADIGSGLVDAACPWLASGPPAWLAGEPGAAQVLATGVALVTFSGDKLLGGPQAGVIAGAADLVARCARHPLARALRPGGLVLAALSECALAYLDRRGHAIPFWHMATISVHELRDRAAALARHLGAPEWVAPDLEAVPGGGTLPGVTIASAGLAVPGDHAEALRRHDPPVIARVEGQHTIVDLRTVSPNQDAVVATALAAVPKR
jgi:L-seryl-tRNA(Ser) seleniumtransferase